MVDVMTVRMLVHRMTVDDHDANDHGVDDDGDDNGVDNDDSVTVITAVSSERSSRPSSPLNRYLCRTRHDTEEMCDGHPVSLLPLLPLLPLQLLCIRLTDGDLGDLMVIIATTAV